MPAFDRQAAWDLLCEFTRSESLRKHALAVEAVMRHFARKAGEDEETWAIAGLLHDFDFEQNPTLETHAFAGARILRERGWPELIARAVESHGDHTGVPRESLMEKTLFAVDELSGFLVACALVKPHKSIFEVDVPSVRRKMKDKAFARAVSRDDIVNGAAQLGVDLDAHIAETIEAMKSAADALGLAGR
ncbi:MAG TPA: HDIG domain-containing protein [Dehalococcoidia bacterium]|nr:HDIG domain-containing protein [Dehalococcoidia bacterium]